MTESHLIPFALVSEEKWENIYEAIKDEHPQIVALVLYQLPSDKASLILSQFQNKDDLILRISNIKTLDPSILREVERAIERRLYCRNRSVDGFQKSLSILGKSSRYDEKTVIGSIEEKDPELADRLKDRLFVFEDLVLLEDKDLKECFSKVEVSELAYSLKAVDPMVFHKVYSNLSIIRRFLLNKILSSLIQVPLNKIEDSQFKITEKLKQYKKSNVREYVC